MNQVAGPISELHQEFCVYNNFVISKSAALIGAIELQGFEPDGLGAQDFAQLSLLARDIYQNLPDNITITQYYSHFNDVSISLKERSDPICDLLSKGRSEHLNAQGLCSSSIVHYFEIAPREDLSKLKINTFFKHFALSFFQEKSRALLKAWFSPEASLCCFYDELNQQQQQLQQVLTEIKARWQALCPAKILDLQQIWAHMRFLSNLDPKLLSASMNEEIPAERWDCCLSDGDLAHIQVNNSDTLKFSNTRSLYARMATISQFGGKEVIPGMWANGKAAPSQLPDNLVCMIRFKPLSKLQKTLLFKRKSLELERKGLNFVEMLTGQTSSSILERKSKLSPALQQHLADLEHADLVDDRWGLAHSFVVCFGADAKKLEQSCIDIKRSLNQSGFHMFWESVDLPDAWRTFLPAGGQHSIRDMPLTTSQLGAASLIYGSTNGQEVVKDLAGEEAQYVFISENRSPFFYNPFVGGRAMVLGVGPIRSGKSFTKNTLATHFMKYNGLFRAIDIDPGTEPVAQCFAKQSGIFRIENDKTQGFNPFASYKGDNDKNYYSHIKQLVLSMIQLNDNVSLQELEAFEQQELDKAITATLALPERLRCLTTLAQHCSSSLQMKLQRWLRGGVYGHLFDQTEDSIGSLDKQLAVFNLAGIKDDPNCLPLVMQEIFYRVTRTFEDPLKRTQIKFLDVDEAGILLKIPYLADYLVRSVRTWGKWRAGISLWTQSPRDFLALSDWPALRTAASTLFFMADPYLDEDLYKQAFALTTGECRAIKNLIPKREAYIIQAEIGVSKKIILDVEPEQYVLSTSSPEEAVIRQQNFEQFGFEKGLAKTILDLKLCDSDYQGAINA